MLDSGKLAVPKGGGPPSVPPRPTNTPPRVNQTSLNPKPPHISYTAPGSEFATQHATQHRHLEEDFGSGSANSPPPLQRGLSRSHTDIAGSMHSSSQVFEQIVLYKSYARETDSPESPYEAHVHGWFYQPHVNRKGKLMIAAIERLVGTPGKFASIEDAAVGHSTTSEDGQASTESSPSFFSSQSSVNSHQRSPSVSSQLIDVSEDTTSSGLSTHSPHSSSWLNFARPQMFRSRSSKSHIRAKSRSLPGSPTGTTPASSSPNSTTNSATNSAVNSAANSAANTAPNSPLLGSQSNERSDVLPPPISLNNANANPAPKKPPMRRTATFTFDPHSNPKGKVYTATHLARKEQKHTIRERMAAISHKSLGMRDVQIVVESAADEKGHRKKRTFWAYTDDSGRFGLCCSVPYKPAMVRVASGLARNAIPLVFVPSSGVSVISDIDDTIRHTGVTKSKRELLQNVLAKSFDDCRLEGVREWYTKMEDAGAHFHYVSNSPWQLYDVIHGYLNHHKFPEGSIHLKKYAGVLDGLTEPVKGRKRAILEKIFRDFPGHKFILIGDSGEADLEAYSELAQKFPDQVLAIYIRDITLPPDEPLNIHERYNHHRRCLSEDLVSFENLSNSSRSNHSHINSKNVPVIPRPNSISGGDAIMGTLPPLRPERPRLAPQLPPRRRGDGVTPLVVPRSAPSTPTSTSSQYSAEAESEVEIASDTDRVVSSGTSSSVSSVDVHGTAASGEPPKPPPRPKLLRKTSSKIMEGMYSMATASSHAAARLLTPQLPPRSNTSRASAARSREPSPSPRSKTQSKTASPFAHNMSPTDDTSHSQSYSMQQQQQQQQQQQHKKQSFHSPQSSDSSAEPENVIEATPPGFVPSSQEITDLDKYLVDKRGEHWKSRVAKQYRSLPKNIQLKMWRHPDDVEAESLKIIRGKEKQSLI